jgi:D-threo-aldose 1-dehydrogenase
VPKTVLPGPPRSFDFDYSYDGVMRSHADSLKRLRVDRIDILLAHDLTPTSMARPTSLRSASVSS